jgi:hypothetical protein
MTQPYVRTVALVAALAGWGCLLVILRHEARGVSMPETPDANRR